MILNIEFITEQQEQSLKYLNAPCTCIFLLRFTGGAGERLLHHSNSDQVHLDQVRNTSICHMLKILSP